MVELYEHQINAVKKLKNGSILVGGVGTGKSRTALAYYVKECKGQVMINGKGKYAPMKEPRDLYIITTAKKRDSGDWIKESVPFCIPSSINVVVDSWNNIKKYKKVHGAFFIFDEQRVTGKGPWVKAFWNICRKNKWILLSATPGDTWKDYMPVFVANGFYKDMTEFNRIHCVFNRFTKYPQIDHYINEAKLRKHRNDILVLMPYVKRAEHRHIVKNVLYDRMLYKRVWKDRWDPYDNVPIAETGKLFYLLRKVVNNDDSRLEAMDEILRDRDSAIVFYNHTYELHKLRQYCEDRSLIFAEWNGEKHEPVPTGKQWLYLVQFAAGAEGWNCITTDTTIFYSQNYSYRATVQAAGRIDRLNTPFDILYYYHIKSFAPIDVAIARALKEKRDFNIKSLIK